MFWVAFLLMKFQFVLFAWRSFQSPWIRIPCLSLESCSGSSNSFYKAFWFEKERKRMRLVGGWKEFYDANDVKI
ncbi:hypothetical protein Bca4012_078730 [Brassica carinata]